MDAIDRQLVEALRANGRSSWAELGREVGLSGPSVQERVKRLEERGVLLGYRAVVAPEHVGLGTSALVGLFQRDDVETDDIVEGVRQIPAVEDCWFVMRRSGARGQGPRPRRRPPGGGRRQPPPRQRRGPDPDDRGPLNLLGGAPGTPARITAGTATRAAAATTVVRRLTGLSRRTSEPRRRSGPPPQGYRWS